MRAAIDRTPKYNAIIGLYCLLDVYACLYFRHMPLSASLSMPLPGSLRMPSCAAVSVCLCMFVFSLFSYYF